MNRKMLKALRAQLSDRPWDAPVDATDLLFLLDALLEEEDPELRASLAARKRHNARIDARAPGAIGAAMARDWRRVQTDIDARPAQGDATLVDPPRVPGDE